MAKKGVQKNTQNKAKHTKLINKKKNKLRKEKDAHKERLKSIINKAKEQQSKDSKQNNNLFTFHKLYHFLIPVIPRPDKLCHHGNVFLI